MPVRFSNTSLEVFADRINCYWDASTPVSGSSGDIEGDFHVPWTGTGTGTVYNPNATEIVSAFEEWQAVLGATMAPQIYGDFQLWNATGQMNMNTINANIALFTGGMDAEFSFNNILADTKKWTGEAYAGAHIPAGIRQWSGSMYGTVGYSIGVSANMSSWTGGLYGGSTVVASIAKMTSTGLISTTSINRVTASLPLWSATISGSVEGRAKVSAALRALTCSMSARFDAPAKINGGLRQWSGNMTGIVQSAGAVEASFLKWGRRDRIFGASGSLPFIDGDFMPVDGELVVIDELDYEILRHVRGRVR